MHTPLIVVTVGTDHHPFNRLMDWLEPWLAAHPAVRCVAQHGTSRPPRGAECHTILPHEDLLSLLAEATAVVCHGGPGTITDARNAGLLPLVVPRNAALGEHVDNHQIRFTTLLSTQNAILLPDSAPTLHTLLTTSLTTPHRTPPTPTDLTPTLTTFTSLIDDLLTSPRRHLPTLRRP
ncbi:glycosyltransferase [Actinocorallia sp. API 0066]|uniref:glycosyltransferase n=1 Tax=Actinocorallia sp. API 0066 TaxID=2896846 RepID=UPI0027DFE8E0|nr:glycosyltransferase [Actinocorallia sp. API 0066]